MKIVTDEWDDDFRRKFDPKKIDAYIDIDGVLFALPRPVTPGQKPVERQDGLPDRINLRPNATSFLYWCDARFNCFWLTAWREKAHQLAYSIYALCAMHWPVCQYQDYKSIAIDFTRPWIWVDDCIEEEDYDAIARYRKPGMIGSIVHADPHSHFELETIQNNLAMLASNNH